MQWTYFDNNATTRPDPSALEEMRLYFEELWGNPSSFYSFSSQLHQHLDRARERVARLIGAKRGGEVFFTSGGTEGNVTAIRSALAQQTTKRHLIASQVEHSSIIHLLQKCEEEGCEITRLPVSREGLVDPQELEAALREDTALVTVMWANNETGAISPVESLAHLCESHGVHFHVDAVQAVGKIPVDISRIPVSSLSLSSHKIHGPKGVGALFIRRGLPFSPLIAGSQEMGRRGGTENVPGIMGFGKACELAAKHVTTSMPRVQKFRDRLETTFLQKIPGAVVNGSREKRLPNTLNMSIKGVEGEALLLHLNELGICASSGSACSTGQLEPSHVLRAMGLSPSHLQGVLRLSLSRFSTEEEVAFLEEKLPEVVKRLT